MKLFEWLLLSCVFLVGVVLQGAACTTDIEHNSAKRMHKHEFFVQCATMQYARKDAHVRLEFFIEPPPNSISALVQILVSYRDADEHSFGEQFVNKCLFPHEAMNTKNPLKVMAKAKIITLVRPANDSALSTHADLAAAQALTPKNHEIAHSHSLYANGVDYAHEESEQDTEKHKYLIAVARTVNSTAMYVVALAYEGEIRSAVVTREALDVTIKMARVFALIAILGVMLYLCVRARKKWERVPGLLTDSVARKSAKAAIQPLSIRKGSFKQ